MAAKGATMLVDGWAGSNAATLDIGAWSKGGPLGAIQKYDNDVQAQTDKANETTADNNKKSTREGKSSKGWG